MKRRNKKGTSENGKGADFFFPAGNYFALVPEYIQR